MVRVNIDKTQGLMQKFTYHSGTARVSIKPCGLALITMSGAMTKTVFRQLRSELLAHIKPAHVGVVDLRSVVALWDDGEWVEQSVRSDMDYQPAAFLVMPEQKPLWDSYARTAAAHGVVRVIFTSRPDALAWASDRSHLRTV
jgi:hypothetical protein